MKPINPNPPISLDLGHEVHQALLSEMMSHSPTTKDHSPTTKDDSRTDSPTTKDDSRTTNDRKCWLPRVSPLPLVVTESQFRNQLQLQHSLSIGIVSGLRLWLKRDRRICSVLRIPLKVESIIREMVPVDCIDLLDPSCIGCYRPDVLFDEEEKLKLCEINARFPLHGYLVTTFLAAATQKGVFGKLSHEGNIYTAIPPTQAFPRMLLQRLLPSVVNNMEKDTLPTIWVIRDREPAHDLIWLASICEGHARVCDATSKELYVDPIDGQLKVGQFTIRSCILELHQDELLALEDMVLKKLVNLSIAKACLNPIWSIFIVHDKKFLSILRQLTIDDLPPSVNNRNLHIEILQRHIIPTCVTDISGLQVMLQSGSTQLLGSSLLVKPPLLGKGEGIIFQKNCLHDDDFLEQVQRSMQSNRLPNYVVDHTFVVQPFIKQATFPIACDPCTSTETENHQRIFLDVNDWSTVGTLLCMDEHYYGPGIFRCSSQDLIALANGGISVVPVFKIPQFPASSVFHIDSLASITSCHEENEIPALRRKMVENGIALLSLQKGLASGKELGDFIETQLQGVLQEPCAGKGSIWIVSPMQAGIARSHQSDEFATHTDASFEKNPPRYFALAVQSVDKKGGGWSGFARIGDAVNQLNLEEYAILRRTMVRWAVPIEFRADPTIESYIYAPVLMSKNRARVRSDVMDSSHLSEGERIRFCQAYEKFYSNLTTECRKSSFLLPEGSILLIDNQRFVHCRSMIQDPTRILVRVRFDLEVGAEVENMFPLLRKCSFAEIPITHKADLMQQIRNDFPSKYWKKGGIYWSPSGGTSSGSLGAEQCTIPSSNHENMELRKQLAEQLHIFGAFPADSIIANLMVCGNLYRSMEIFTDVFVYNNCTNLPIGADVQDEIVLNMIQYFGANVLCGWPSRLLKLVSHVRSDPRTKDALRGIKSIIHGGEVLTESRRKVLLEMCAPNCSIYGVFGSAEVGVFACTDGSEENCDVYYPIPDLVHVEVVDDDDKLLPVGETGLIVVTNLLRKSHQPIIRYCMDDRGQLLHSEDGITRLRVIGRSETGISFPLGPIFLYWNDIQKLILSHFEAISPSKNIVGQIWITSDVFGKDILTIKLFIEGLEDINPAVLSQAGQIALATFQSHIAEVPNVLIQGISYFHSMSEVAFSSRSRKIMYFVDKRTKRGS